MQHDQATNELFFKLLAGVISYCVDRHRHRGLHVLWDCVHQIVQTVAASFVTTSESADKIVIMSDYILDGNGDPLTNGLGHKIILHEGFECVEIPARKEWSRTRGKEQRTEMRTTISDSTQDVWDGQTAEAFDDLSGSLFKAFPRAGGMLLSQIILGSGSSSSAPGLVDQVLAGCPAVVGDDDSVMRPPFAWVQRQQSPTQAKRPATAPVEGQAEPPKKVARKPPDGSPTKAKATSTATSSDGQRGRGRPKHDRKEHVTNMLVEYAGCGQDEKFFGNLTSFKRSPACCCCCCWCCCY
jgi:hypothetical protein